MSSKIGRTFAPVIFNRNDKEKVACFQREFQIYCNWHAFDPANSIVTWKTSNRDDSGGVQLDTVQHIQKYVCPYVTFLLTPLIQKKGAVPHFIIEQCLNMYESRYANGGLKLHGSSAGISIALGMISAALQIPLKQDILCTGSFSNAEGDIGIVGNIYEKFQTAFSQNREKWSYFIIPKLSFEDLSLKSINQTACLDYETDVKKLKSMVIDSSISIIEISNIDEIWEYIIKEIDIVGWLYKEKSIIINECVNLGIDKKLSSKMTRHFNFVKQNIGDILFHLAREGSVLECVSWIQKVLYLYKIQDAFPAEIFKILKNIYYDPKTRECIEFVNLWWEIAKEKQETDYVLVLVEILQAMPSHLFKITYLNNNHNPLILRNLLQVLLENKYYDILSLSIEIIGRKISCESVMNLFKDDLDILISNWTLEVEQIYNDSNKDYFKQINLDKRLDISFPPTIDNDFNDWLSRIIEKKYDLFYGFISECTGLFNFVNQIYRIDPAYAKSKGMLVIEWLFITREKDLVNELKQSRWHPTCYNQYREIVKQLDSSVFQKLYNAGYTLRYLFNQLVVDCSNEARLKPEKPILKIHIDVNLSSMQFFVPFDNSDDRGNRIHQPVLLWQESKNLCEFWRSNSWEENLCEINILPDAEDNESGKPGIKSLFINKNMIIEIEDIQILWNMDFEWPPSIDSFFFISTLSKYGYFEKKNIHSLWDIGCGTGVLGVALAKRNESVKRVLFSDLDKKKGLLLHYNVEHNLSDRLKLGLKYTYKSGEGLACNDEERNWDIILCSPPYLPGKEFYESVGIKRATNGTVLLEDAVLYGLDHSKEVLLQFSKLAWPEFEFAIKNTNNSYQILDIMSVPFKVPSVAPYKPEEMNIKKEHPNYEIYLDQYHKLKEYTLWLLREKRIMECNKRNFRFWHDIVVVKLIR